MNMALLLVGPAVTVPGVDGIPIGFVSERLVIAHHAAELARTTRLMLAGGLEPDNVAAAIRHSEEGHTRGKIIIDVQQSAVETSIEESTEQRP